MPHRQEIVDGLAETWSSLGELGDSLGPDQWELPTGCPGWSVKDQFSHIIGTEWMLLGRDTPSVDESRADYVRNEIGAFNERWVRTNRPKPGADVLAEFRSVTSRRLDLLSAMGDDDFEAPAMTPVGPGTYGDFMAIRLFDCWVHEQDVRRAVGRPGHLSGPVAEHSLAMIQGSLPRTVAKLAGAPEGSSVVFALEEPLSREWAVGVEGGRGRRLDAVPVPATATVRSDLETFVSLTCGRADPAEALAEGRVELAGDQELGRAVVSNLAFTF